MKTSNLTAIFILLMLTAVILSSCGQASVGEVSSGGSESATSEDGTSEELFVRINSDNAASFTIVRPEKCDSELISAVSEFRSALSRCGLDVKIKDDWVRDGESAPAGTPEILVGNTNREESRKYYDRLKVDDYIIAVEGGRIIILGGSAQATQKAIDKFVSEYIKNFSGELKLPYQVLHTHTGRYSAVSVLLHGKDISSYQIVIPKSADHILRYAASFISNSVSEFCGSRVDVVEEGNDRDGPKIVISYEGVSLNEDEYLFKTEGDSFGIFCGKRTVLQSVRALMSPLADGSSDFVDITPDEGLKKISTSAHPLPSSLEGKTPIGLCDQLNNKAVVIDLSASDPTSDAAVLWEWTPSAKNGFSGAGFSNRIDELKFRYSEVLGKYIVCVTSSSGFIGIAEYPSGQKIWEFNASGYGPHSIEYLPNGLVACALSGNSSTEKGQIRIYASNSDGTPSEIYIKDSLASAHAVHWDDELGILWAMGGSEIIAYEISGTPKNPTMTRIEGFGANIGSGGHDFSADPNDDGLFWFSTSSVNLFDKYENKVITSYTGKNMITSKSVKCICELPDGRVLRTVATGVYQSHNTDTLTVFTPNAVGNPSKTEYVFKDRAFYKARPFLLY